jgi:hypothetical protein
MFVNCCWNKSLRPAGTIALAAAVMMDDFKFDVALAFITNL